MSRTNFRNLCPQGKAILPFFGYCLYPYPMFRTNFRNICPQMTVRTQTIVFALNSSDLIDLFYFLALPDIMSYTLRLLTRKG